MNWFTRVRNSITSLSKRSTEKDLWVKCPSCQQMVFAQEYEDNSYVCPRCGHHGRIGADGSCSTKGSRSFPSPM